MVCKMFCGTNVIEKKKVKGKNYRSCYSGRCFLTQIDQVIGLDNLLH